jgi:hypothetical protein
MRNAAAGRSLVVTPRVPRSAQAGEISADLSGAARSTPVSLMRADQGVLVLDLSLAAA